MNREEFQYKNWEQNEIIQEFKEYLERKYHGQYPKKILYQLHGLSKFFEKPIEEVTKEEVIEKTWNKPRNSRRNYVISFNLFTEFLEKG